MIVFSTGFISFSDVYTSNNAPNGNGIFITNQAGTAGVTLKDTCGISNGLNGIQIITSGPITLTNFTATGNGAYGIVVQNVTILKPQPVTIKGMDTSNNSSTGLYINTMGTISLTNITSNQNHRYGVLLGAGGLGEIPSSVTITNATINYNGYTLGGYDNLRILSGGSVTLTGIDASHCSLDDCFGAILGDDPVVSHPIGGTVTISKSAFDDNKMDGLAINSKGKIVLSQVRANYNNQNGANLSNFAGDPLFPTISVSNGEFSNNLDDGLISYSRGGITLTNIQANGNSKGAYVRNISGNVSLLITGNNTNAFNNNSGSYGICVDTAGSVILNRVAASGNFMGAGVLVRNSGIPHLVGNVTINGGTFSGNSSGLNVTDSIGIIQVNGIAANDNVDFGALFDNTNDQTGTKGITINKSTFDRNGQGMEVHSWGQITLNKVSASYSTSGTGPFCGKREQHSGWHRREFLCWAAWVANLFNSNGGQVWRSTARVR